MRKPARRRERQSGSAMVEIALMSPWIFFLFVGVFDFGFYAYQIISTENAARAAAVRTSMNVGSQSDTLACNAAYREMNGIPNITPSVLTNNCSQLPLQVVRRTLCNQGTVRPTTIVCEAPCAIPPPASCADCAVDNTAASSEVCVTYQSDFLIPIPGVLTNQMTLTRVAEMRILAK